MRIPLQRRSTGSARRYIEEAWRDAGMPEEEIQEALSHLVIVYESNGFVAVRWDDEWQGPR